MNRTEQKERYPYLLDVYIPQLKPTSPFVLLCEDCYYSTLVPQLTHILFTRKVGMQEASSAKCYACDNTLKYLISLERMTEIEMINQLQEDCNVIISFGKHTTNKTGC